MQLLPSRTSLMVAPLPAGMTEFDGMCSMPVAAEGVYANYTETSEPKGMMNMDSDVDYYTAVEPLTPHFHEPIGQVRATPTPQVTLQPSPSPTCLLQVGGALHGPFSSARC